MRSPALRRAAAVLLLAACAIVAGCQSLGLAPADTFEEKLAYAYGTHAAVQIAAARALDAKEISSDDGTTLLQLADESRVLLDAARLANSAGDTSTAEGKLLLASTVLTQLETYLRARATKPAGGGT